MLLCTPKKDGTLWWSYVLEDGKLVPLTQKEMDILELEAIARRAKLLNEIFDNAFKDDPLCHI